MQLKLNIAYEQPAALLDRLIYGPHTHNGHQNTLNQGTFPEIYIAAYKQNTNKNNTMIHTISIYIILNNLE
jgi:hypothetical protein